MDHSTGNAQAQTFFGNAVPPLPFHIGRYPIYQGLDMAFRGIGTIGLGILYR